MAQVVQDSGGLGQGAGILTGINAAVTKGASQDEQGDASGLVVNNVGLQLLDRPDVVQNKLDDGHVRLVRDEVGEASHVFF